LPRTPAVVRFASLSAIAVGLATLALPAATAGASGSRQSLRSDLIGRAGGHATFLAAHGTAGVFFGAQPGHAATRPAGVSSHDDPGTAATGWMRRYGALFGVRDAARDLRTEQVQPTPGGAAVRLAQTVSGLPVVGGEVSVLLDADNDLMSVAGHVSTATTADSSPLVSANTAKTLAVRAVAKQRARPSRGEGLAATDPVLSVLDQSLLSGPVVTAPLSVWATTVTSADHLVRHDVYVEATHGGIALNLDDNPQATRTVCQPAGYNGSLKSEKIADPTCVGPDTEIVSTPGSSSDLDVSDAYRFAVDVDQFYLKLLGRNSLDGKGMDLNSTAHFCDANDPDPGDCPLPNAFWDGHEMVYGDGYSRGLDVVGHEMTHGVTEHTSNLFSYYQSGAINESQSDVMGELIQQIEGSQENASSSTVVYDPAKPWLIGEQLPGGPFRHMDHPESDTRFDANGNPVAAPDPDSMTSSHYDAAPFYVDNGGVHENALVGDKAAFLIAAGANGHGGGIFNTYSITGVDGGGSTADPRATGVTEDTAVRDVKTANIYYQLDKMMVSATTYADLYKLLPQACDALVGKSLPMPAAWTTTPTKITSGDCGQVRLAVKATKMNVLPTKSGAAVATPSPYCTNGGSATGRRTDSFESKPFPDVYTRSHATTVVPDPYGGRFTSGEYGSWGWTKDYQLSGSTASLWGDDADPFAASPNQSRPAFAYEDARAQKVAAVRAAVGTYVRYRTAWDFDSSPASQGDPVIHNFDGGVVEYSVDAGSSWHNARVLFVNNGYNGVISNTDDLWVHGYRDPNPLKGRRGFVRDSHGWTASRLDLSSLHGKRVLLRWRIGADDSVGGIGWFVDNVQSYSCNPTHVGISAPARVRAGRAALVSGHLVRAGTHTALRNLPVTLWEKRHSATRWIRVGTRTTNTYGNVHWYRTHSSAEDYRVRMPGKTPFAPSNYSRTTVRIR
jgi:bacillolysin